MNILLVEDNEADAYLLMEFFEKYNVDGIRWVTDGRAALDFVAQKGEYSGSPRPDVILMDLGLPRISGYDALKKLKDDPSYANIPVVVLTTSCNPLDQRQCMDLGANAFFSKPHNLKGYEELTHKLATAELPRLAA